MSLAERITKTNLFNSGRSFTAAEVAAELGVPRKNLSSALIALRENARIKYDAGKYQMVATHWINKAALNDARKLRAARIEDSDRKTTALLRCGNHAGNIEPSAPRNAGTGSGASASDGA